MDLEMIKDWIIDNNPKTIFIEELSNKVLEYVDKTLMEDEGYDSGDELRYYEDFGSGEAEADMIDNMIIDAEEEFDVSIENEDYQDLFDDLLEYYVESMDIEDNE